MVTKLTVYLAWCLTGNAVIQRDSGLTTVQEAHKLMRNCHLEKNASKCHWKSSTLYQSMEALGSHALFSLLLPLREQEEQFV